MRRRLIDQVDHVPSKNRVPVGEARKEALKCTKPVRQPHAERMTEDRGDTALFVNLQGLAEH